MSWTVLTASHGGWTNTSPQNRFFWPLWLKTPILGGTERQESKTKTIPSRIPVVFFPCRIIPPTLEPCCCSRKTAGCLPLHQSWDRQSAKAQQGAFFFFFYFLSKIKINTFSDTSFQHVQGLKTCSYLTLLPFAVYVGVPCPCTLNLQKLNPRIMVVSCTL